MDAKTECKIQRTIQVKWTLGSLCLNAKTPTESKRPSINNLRQPHHHKQQQEIKDIKKIKDEQNSVDEHGYDPDDDQDSVSDICKSANNKADELLNIVASRKIDESPTKTGIVTRGNDHDYITNNTFVAPSFLDKLELYVHSDKSNEKIVENQPYNGMKLRTRVFSGKHRNDCFCCSTEANGTVTNSSSTHAPKGKNQQKSIVRSNKKIKSLASDDGISKTSKLNLPQKQKMILNTTKGKCLASNPIMKKLKTKIKHSNVKKREFKCHLCAMHFSSSKLFMSHFSFSHGRKEKRHPVNPVKCVSQPKRSLQSLWCNVCYKLFPDAQSQSEHVKTHYPGYKNQFKFKCYHCFQGFTYKWELDMHTCKEKQEEDSEKLSSHKEKTSLTETHQNMVTKEYNSSDVVSINLPINNNTHESVGELHDSKEMDLEDDFPLDVDPEEDWSDVADTEDVKKTTHQVIVDVKDSGKPSFEEIVRTKPCKRGKATKCEQCSVVFPTPAILEIHKKCHDTDNRRHKCTVCSLAYTTGDALRSHMTIHTGEKNYKCDICDRVFARRSYLWQHRKRCSGEFFKCNICGQRFISPDQERKHRLSHTDDNRFRCVLCDSVFTHESELITHKRKAHFGILRKTKAGGGLTMTTKLGLHNDEIVDRRRKKGHQKSIIKKLETKTETIKQYAASEPLTSVLIIPPELPVQSLPKEETNANPNSYVCKYCGKEFPDDNTLSIHELKEAFMV